MRSEAYQGQFGTPGWVFLRTCGQTRSIAFKVIGTLVLYMVQPQITVLSYRNDFLNLRPVAVFKVRAIMRIVLRGLTKTFKVQKP